MYVYYYLKQTYAQLVTYRRNRRWTFRAKRLTEVPNEQLWKINKLVYQINLVGKKLPEFKIDMWHFTWFNHRLIFSFSNLLFWCPNLMSTKFGRLTLIWSLLSCDNHLNHTKDLVLSLKICNCTVEAYH